MSKNRKMCKYKDFSYIGLMGRLNGKQTVICSNAEIDELTVEAIKKDLKKCSARLCPYYVSK